MKAWSKPIFSLSRSGHLVTIVVVGLAYGVTIWGYLGELNRGETPAFTTNELIIGILLGIVYVALIMAGPDRFRPVLGRVTIPLYFLLLTGLVIIIFLLLAISSGIWLVAMPLAAIATTDLNDPWRWLVYLVVLAAFTISFFITSGSWEVAFAAGLTFAPAVVFVIIFMRLTQAAEEAQSKAERLALELEDANHQLAAYAIQAEELATTQERNRLAREIHDSLGHYLTVVNVQIKAALAVMDKDPTKAKTALEKAGQLTNEGLAAVRQSVSSLRDSPLGSRSLPEAIGALVAQSQSTGIVTELSVVGDHPPLDPRVELTLYRTAQEGLTNVRRHARASRVDLILNYRDHEQVMLQVRDNGPGLAASEVQPGFGLLGLAERARQLGGRSETESAPGLGFCLTVTIPDPPVEQGGVELASPGKDNNR
jgi:signal transduction histidine kinase